MHLAPKIDPLALLASLALLAACPLQASVLLRCGGGSVATDGFVINGNGEVVFSEDSILCNADASHLAQPLVLTIEHPPAGTTISTNSVEVTAGIANFDVSHDDCGILVQPPHPYPSGTPVAMVPIDGVATADVPLVNGSTGVHTLQLFCTRTLAGQQVRVPTATRAINVVGALPPPSCSAASTPPIFSPVTQVDFTAPYVGDWASPGAGGFGGPPDQPLPWRYWYFRNSFSHGELSSLELKTWVFRPPAHARASLVRGPAGNSGIAVSLGHCPGTYLDIPAACRNAFGNLHWSTVPGDDPAHYCMLEAGRDYFLNAAAFDLEALVASGGLLYQAGPACAGQPCTVIALYQAGARSIP